MVTITAIAKNLEFLSAVASMSLGILRRKWHLHADTMRRGISNYLCVARKRGRASCGVQLITNPSRKWHYQVHLIPGIKGSLNKQTRLGFLCVSTPTKSTVSHRSKEGWTKLRFLNAADRNFEIPSWRSQKLDQWKIVRLERARLTKTTSNDTWLHEGRKTTQGIVFSVLSNWIHSDHKQLSFCQRSFKSVNEQWQENRRRSTKARNLERSFNVKLCVNQASASVPVT